VADAIDSLTMNNQPWSEVQAVKSRRPDAQEVQWDYGYIHYLRFNCQKAPFNDDRLRSALRLAVDVKAIGDGFYGPLWDYTGPLVSTWTNEALSSEEIKKRPGWNPATRDADIAEAKKLMAAAGFPDGALTAKLMVFNTPVHPANSERVRAQWVKVWPKMNISFEGPLDSGPWNQRLAANNFDMMAYSNLPTTDGAVEFQNFYASDGSRNYGKFADAEVDKMANAALQEFDIQKRGKIIKDAQEIVINKSPIISYYFARQIAFVSPKIDGIQGYPGPGGQGAADLVEAAKVVSIKG
jgi:oligopeptide transport system substrate-binding protein